MGQLGHFAPSISNISINFRTGDNKEEVLQKLYINPQILQNNFENNETIKHEIFYERGAPFIKLQTNLCEMPIKLLIDTGAAVSIVADDVINTNIQKTNYFLTLFGIVGSDVSVTTKGIINGIFRMNGTHLGTTRHLVDRKHAGSGDGYLGFDFLAPYRFNIDLNRMCLIIDLSKITKGEKLESNCMEKNIELQENYIENNKNEHNELKNETKKYENAVKFFRTKFDEYEKHLIPMNTFNLFPIREHIRREQILKQLNLNETTEHERNIIQNITTRYPFQFYIDGEPIGATHVIKHQIHLKPDAKIINVKQYRIPKAHKSIMQEIINEYEHLGIIEKCQSPYNSPAILVSIKDDMVR